MRSRTHLGEAQRFEQFLGRIEREPFPEWIVTVRFYVALHYVDSVIAARMPSHHGAGHPGRRGRMRQLAETQAVLAEYHRLETMSYEARYHGTRFPATALEMNRACYGRVRRRMRTASGLPA